MVTDQGKRANLRLDSQGRARGVDSGAAQPGHGDAGEPDRAVLEAAAELAGVEPFTCGQADAPAS